MTKLYYNISKQKGEKQTMFYSQKEFAKLVGVTVQTLVRWEKAGYIKPIRKIPHRPRYSDEQLKELTGYMGENVNGNVDIMEDEL